MFYDLQFGFRKQHSTNHALIDIVENIRQKLDAKTFSCGVFIDLEKAFDTVNHEILLQKLYFYGIRGVGNSWFKSYLENRNQRVKLGGIFSSYHNVTCGVPQGSILGPLLFLIYINDMKDAVKHSIVHHFADDTNLLCSDMDENVLKRKMNEDLRLLFDWLCANRLSLNVDKTEFIVFRPPRTKLKNRFTLKLNRITLYESSKIKYLGLILDARLSWKYHIYEWRKKLNRAVGILYKMRKTNCSQSVLLSLYHSIFSSHLCYGICVYGLAEEQYTNIISLIQKKAIRIIANAAYNAHTAPIFRDLKLLNFSKIIKFSQSMLMWDFEKGALPNCFDNFFEKVNNVHGYNTRSSSKNKLSENTSVRTETHGKKLFRFIGPRLYNELVNLNLFESCKTKSQFNKKIKTSQT